VRLKIMSPQPDPDQIAQELRVVIGVLRRRLRATDADGDLTMPESAALARLDRGGPATAAALAKAEQMSPQSMGATLGRLENRGLVAREPDPDDGRRIVLSITPAGVETMRGRRSARAAQLARALESEFSGPELRALAAAAELLRRLAEAL
jgi:DNA-binding MarR family transcriptional regulator